jgi:hypothetical protein
MHSITVNFGPNSTSWAFAFNTKEAADSQFQRLRTMILGVQSGAQVISIEDDFGQSATLIVADIHAFTLEDPSLQGEAHNQRMLAMARSQAKYDNLILADTDPELKKAVQRQRQQQMQQRFVAGGMGPGPFPSA